MSRGRSKWNQVFYRKSHLANTILADTLAVECDVSFGFPQRIQIGVHRRRIKAKMPVCTHNYLYILMGKVRMRK